MGIDEIGSGDNNEVPVESLAEGNEGKKNMEVGSVEEDPEEDEGEDEEDIDDGVYTFRFKDGINPLDFVEDNASSGDIQPYQEFERLEREALADKKRKALAECHGEESVKKSRQEEISGASMEEIMELMNFGVRRKSRKVKRRGRRKGSKKRLSPEITRMLGEATLHYAHGRYDEAITMLHKVVRLAPNVSDSYHTLGLVYNSLGDDKKTMDFYMIAAHLTPKDSSLWKLLFTWSIEQRDIGQASYCLSKAITADPKDISLRIHRASLFVELGDNKKAAETYEQIFHLCPENVDALKTAAQLYKKCGQVEHSLCILENYIRDQSPAADLSMINLLVDILMETKAYEKALAQIEHAEALCCSGERLPLELRVKAGICHAHLGNMEMSQVLVRDLHRENACDHMHLIIAVAESLRILGHYDSAIKCYLMLKGNRKGEDGMLYLKIGQCYLSLKERTQAILHFYKDLASSDFTKIVDVTDKILNLALETLPDDVDARITLASLLLDEGKEEEAISLLSPPHDTELNGTPLDESKKWWMHVKVKLKLSHIYRAKGMLHEFVETILSIVRESLHVASLRQKGKVKKLSKSELVERVKLLYDRETDNVFRGFRPVAPPSDLLKASRAKRQLQSKEMLKQKKKEEALAAGIDWESDDSDNEPARINREPPLPNLLKDEEQLQLTTDLCKALVSLRKYWEALEIINLTLRLAKNTLAVGKKEELRSIAAQIAYNTTDPKHGFDCVKHIIQQYPYSLAAWNCYYKVISRLENRDTRHYKLMRSMQGKLIDCVPPILISGHQFTICSHHQDAARKYLEAYKVLPENPLINLCVGSALINLALGFRLQNKHQCLVQGLAFLYNNLRICESSQEALYNIARAFHHVGMVTLAAQYYEKVLATCEKDYPVPKLLNEDPEDVVNRRQGYCDLRREAAYNLHLIYKKSGSVDLARQVLKDYCTF